MPFLRKKLVPVLSFIYLFFKNTPSVPKGFGMLLYAIFYPFFNYALMKIAILEICASTHYTLTNALIKTYRTDPNNSIVVYTNEFIAKAIQESGVHEATTFVIFDDQKPIAPFLKEIENTSFDRLHICTIEGYYHEFALFEPNVKKLFFHVHDIDMWFESSLKNTYKNFIYNISNYPDKVREIARFGRDVLVRNPARQKILVHLQKSNLYYIVLSARQKDYLSQYVDNDKIIAFPSIINEGIEKPQNPIIRDGKIRICIPGIVTDTRRDYSGLFKILEDILPQIKGKLMFDFLGFVDKRELNLLHKMRNLEKMGLDVLYSEDFVDAMKFDDALDKADILLNNQKVNVSHTGKYGQTKESGLLFNIVRGAKPAIFPQAYSVDAEFEGAILYYDSDNMLKDMLLKLANGHILLEKNKIKAAEIAQNYTPKSLYKRLVNTAEMPV